jgi:hypothetical protein
MYNYYYNPLPSHASTCTCSLEQSTTQHTHTTPPFLFCPQAAASSGQLDAVASLLQQRRAVITADCSAVPSALDELLLLAFLQAQLASLPAADWSCALELFQRMRADRGPGFGAGNSPLLGALLELLVAAGGPDGLLAAVTLVEEAHAAGACVHNSYTI